MGTGRMAGIMADTIREMDDAQLVAVGSRKLETAQAFVEAHCGGKGAAGLEAHCGKREAASNGGDAPMAAAYGSYEELVNADGIDLVYVATPHSEHFVHAGMAIDAGKAVLCEKAFCGNARMARELIEKAHASGVFIAEAMWIRYKPFVQLLPKLIQEIDPQMLTCSLGYPKWFKPTITQPELCGGAMMDLGVYLLNFARICFGSDVAETRGFCLKSPETGLDVQDCISLIYNDGRLANMQCSVMCANDRQGMISGKLGYIIVDNINNPQEYRVFDKDHQLTATYRSDAEITGYEYELRACHRALLAGKTEPDEMPHAETIKVLEAMDALRYSWGVKFPCD